MRLDSKRAVETEHGAVLLKSRNRYAKYLKESSQLRPHFTENNNFINVQNEGNILFLVPVV